MLKHILILLLAAGMAGCSTTLIRQEPEAIKLGESRIKCETAPLAEALLTYRGVSKQALSGHWHDRTFAAECVLKGEAGRFTAVFLAPHMRLATLTLTPPHALQFERAKEIPSAFDPEYLLFDLAVVNLPIAQLRRALGDAFQVDEHVHTRRVYAGGREIAKLIRATDGRRIYENCEFNYGYTVKEMR